MGEYYSFKIYEPKERLILALPFRDRVLQQWYVEEFVKPVFKPKFIKDSYACIEEKGLHLAVKNLQKYMIEEISKYCRKNNVSYEEAKNKIYVLKCDIAKFFYNIDKDVLFNIIKKKTKGKEFIDFTKYLIYSDGNEKGVAIR